MKVAKCFRGKGQGMNSSKVKRWNAKDAKSDPVQKAFRKADNRRTRKESHRVEVEEE